MLYNADLQHAPGFDCNQQALLDGGAKPLIDFNAFRHYMQFIDMNTKLNLPRTYLQTISFSGSLSLNVNQPFIKEICPANKDLLNHMV